MLEHTSNTKLIQKKTILVGLSFLAFAIVCAVAVFVLFQYTQITEEKKVDNEGKKEQNR
jgi:hypothetical protein